jgi:hypothetical protein
MVVVPWAPGPLLVPAGDRTPDGIDDLVDELFGSDIDEQPSWFDLGLFAGGAGLFAWSLLSGASTALVVIGAIAGLLGCILPIRAAWRAVRGRGVQRRRQAVLERGLALAAEHPATSGLISAYRSLLAGAALPAAAAFGEEAVTAAHQALVEVATRLDGKPPTRPDDVEYIASRTNAVETLSEALADHQRRLDARAARAAAAAAEAEEELQWTARREATAELESQLGPDSLDRLELLARHLEAGDDDPDH